MKTLKVVRHIQIQKKMPRGHLFYKFGSVVSNGHLCRHQLLTLTLEFTDKAGIEYDTLGILFNT